jgi:hypothetical protein
MLIFARNRRGGHPRDRIAVLHRTPNRDGCALSALKTVDLDFADFFLTSPSAGRYDAASRFGHTPDCASRPQIVLRWGANTMVRLCSVLLCSVGLLFRLR